MCTHSESSPIHNNQKVQQPECPSMGMDKHSVPVHTLHCDSSWTQKGALAPAGARMLSEIS